MFLHSALSLQNSFHFHFLSPKCWKPEGFLILHSVQLQSFSALKNFGSARARARAQPEKLCSRSRSSFSRPCARARAQNFWAPLNFALILRFWKSFNWILYKAFSLQKRAFLGNTSLIFENGVLYRKMSLYFCVLERFSVPYIGKNDSIFSAKMRANLRSRSVILRCARAQRS